MSKKTGLSLCFVTLIFLCRCDSMPKTIQAIASTSHVSTTNNPQVALYTITPTKDANVQIEFGTDTSYGRSTSVQAAPAGGGTVNILVAGLKPFTTYHMRADVDFPDGSEPFDDDDQVFVTGGIPASQFPSFTVTNPAGLTPQPGIEMLDLVGQQPNVVALDLSGNVIWTYSFTGGTSSDIIQPVKLLPNGHFLVQITPTSSFPLNNAPPPGTIFAVREVDLAGTTVRELTLDALQASLATAGVNLPLLDMHHDVLPLPNGHWIILANITKEFPQFGNTPILGDVLVDVDPNNKVDWTWSAFDHLDVNRQPFSHTDWTHANALLYSPDDGNLLLSMRHQHWVIKIDYNNGLGAGDVLWRLGNQGDFTLSGGTDPTDWFYAQHGPSFTTPQTAGQFSLVLFDNGNGRQFPPGDTCTITPTPACNFSTVPMLQIDENARTAALVFHDKLPVFSFFGGGAQMLPNGNIEFDECGISTSPPSAQVFEVTNQPSPQTVWELEISGAFAYRAFRLPSLYPGVQW
ncbi:MAG: aryl-sulfate sulfotransferase [Candidatus Acidiferrales bacterium]